MARLFCCEDIPGVFSGILTGPVLYALIDGQGVDVSQWLLDCLCGRRNEVVAPPLEGKISAERKATAERRLVAMGTVCSARHKRPRAAVVVLRGCWVAWWVTLETCCR